MPADAGETDGDGGVYVTARDIHGRRNHDGEHEAVSEGDADEADGATCMLVYNNGASANEYEDKDAEEFSEERFDGVHGW